MIYKEEVLGQVADGKRWFVTQEVANAVSCLILDYKTNVRVCASQIQQYREDSCRLSESVATLEHRLKAIDADYDDLLNKYNQVIASNTELMEEASLLQEKLDEEKDVGKSMAEQVDIQNKTIQLQKRMMDEYRVKLGEIARLAGEQAA